MTLAPGLPTRLVTMMAVACALAVSTLYYHQPLLPQMAASFGLAPSQAGLIATLTQLGYALGLVLIVPLADSRQPRRLASLVVVANAIALLGCAVTPGFVLLCVSSLLVGVTAITAQIIIPVFAGLAAPDKRGQIVGTLLGGLSAGLLVARTVGGLLGEQLGWRAVFAVAALIDLLLLVIIVRRLPVATQTTSTGYCTLLRSLVGLLREEQVLRFCAASGFFTFAAFSALWATLAILLTQPPYRFGPAVIGLFSLATLPGIVVSSRIGAMVDHLGARAVACAGTMSLIVGYVCITGAGSGLVWLIPAMVLLDLGNRASLMANQSRVQALRADARSRLNTVFMSAYFLGGAAGAALANYGVHRAGWLGLAATGALLALAAATINARSPRESSASIVSQR